jgi:voltage-gated potassium channel
MARLKSVLYATLEPGPAPSRATKYAMGLLAVLIGANVLAVILQTVNSLDARFGQAFLIFEYVSVAIFSIEYLIRIWICTQNPKYSRPVLGRLRYIVSPIALIDLLAIAPFFLPFVTTDLRILRVLRLARLLRVFKLGRYSDALATLGRVARKKRAQLGVILVFLGLALVISASIIYYVENPHQPDKFSSIPASLWWAIVTLTTVGYGDMWPVTILGKILTGVIALTGIGLFALPAGILASGFSGELEHDKEPARTMAAFCPHCGASLPQVSVEHRRITQHPSGGSVSY